MSARRLSDSSNREWSNKLHVPCNTWSPISPVCTSVVWKTGENHCVARFAILSQRARQTTGVVGSFPWFVLPNRLTERCNWRAHTTVPTITQYGAQSVTQLESPRWKRQLDVASSK